MLVQSGSALVFVAKTKTPNEWKIIASTIQTLVEEASFEGTTEGLSFRAMDPSHVALIDLNWPNAGFEKYDCDKQHKLTVRVEEFAKLLRRANTKDAVTIQAEDDDMLALKFQNGYKREFKIHLIESTYSPTPLPKLSFNSKIVLKESAFEDILSDVSTISDHIILESSKEKVTFMGKSDSGSASIPIEKNNDALEALEVKEESKATYSLQYLLNIVKAAGASSEKVTCEYSNKMPLKLEFALGDTGGRISFYLAPRIEER